MDAIPLYAVMIIVVVLVLQSAMFAGLTLGLLGLDINGLKILIESGTPQEQSYARAILPLRKHGNFLLCTFLLGNTMVNAITAVLLADVSDGIVGTAIATAVLLIFSEVLPQAICNRHGLVIGAKLRWLVVFYMAVFSPIVWPLSKALDYFLGEELGTIHNRKGLKKLLEIHASSQGITEDETRVMTGALQLSQKTVSSIMTPVKDCFMLHVDTKLSFDNLRIIFESGYSRIPVYEGKLESSRDVIGLLFVKDLLLLSPEDEIPVRTVMAFYNRALVKVFGDETLQHMLNVFKAGGSHLAIVHEINNDGPGDPFRETKGLITMEDILEEIIQANIQDERDIGDVEVVASDVRVKRKKAKPLEGYMGLISRRHHYRRPQLSPHEAQIVFSHLISSLEIFRQLPEQALRSYILDAPLTEIKEGDASRPAVYSHGKPADFMTLVLSGKLTILAGAERFESSVGSWSCLAVRSLMEENYTADFTALPNGHVRYITIPKADFDRLSAGKTRTSIVSPDGGTSVVWDAAKKPFAHGNSFGGPSPSPPLQPSQSPTNSSPALPTVAGIHPFTFAPVQPSPLQPIARSSSLSSSLPPATTAAAPSTSPPSVARVSFSSSSVPTTTSSATAAITNATANATNAATNALSAVTTAAATTALAPASLYDYGSSSPASTKRSESISLLSAPSSLAAPATPDHHHSAAPPVSPVSPSVPLLATTASVATTSASDVVVSIPPDHLS